MKANATRAECPLLHDEDRYRDEVLCGLRRTPKRLSSKFFYDARGSALFEQICEQPEYYLTRAELELLELHADQIGATLGDDVLLIEYGSGSARKTARLLGAMPRAAGYLPVEISRAALDDSVKTLARLFPALPIAPLYADFTNFNLDRPALPAHRRRVVYFPGSTLGNFETSDAIELLRQMRGQIGGQGAALIGIDLRKDEAVMEAAYNDAAGITSAFTLNMLTRFNRELDASFQLEYFRHQARYNAVLGRIETHIVSTREQRVSIAGTAVRFAADEAMLVEYSYKYSAPGFAMLAARAGLRVQGVWTDPDQRFSVQLLMPR
jgi:dimethylhistidine N-methyltransferase